MKRLPPILFGLQTTTMLDNKINKLKYIKYINVENAPICCSSSEPDSSDDEESSSVFIGGKSAFVSNMEMARFLTIFGDGENC